ncbi:MAG: NADPH:quinone reductase [Pseudomonadota bacterium]
MRAITYESFGPADAVLQAVEMPDPQPAAGDVLIRLKTSGVNPSDVKARAGARPGVTKPPFPRIIPHSDGAGVIEAVGDSVDPGRVGERVWIWNGQWQRAFGTAAEYIALPSAQAVPLPDPISFEEGATLGIPALTACHAVLGGGPVAGRRVLVNGSAGTVGRLAVQIAKAHGAQVLATARGADGFEAARTAGADHVFDYTDPARVDGILEATEGQPIERIVEVEFGQNATTNTALIAENGTIASYGSAKEMEPKLPFYPLMFKAVTIDLILIYLLDGEKRSAAITHLTDLLNRRALDLRISQILPLDACAQAHEIVATGERSGSVILEI